MGLNRSGIFLASVTYTDLGSMYFKVVRPEQIDEIYRYLAKNHEIREAVVLWTCNRFEIYFHPGTHANLQYVKGYLEGRVSNYRISHGSSVIRHLFHVAAGLDSMLVGENEILGQTKNAWQLARRSGMCGSEMNLLFRGAVESGKRVRAKTPIGRLRRSVSRESVELFEASGGADPILVVGAGAMGRQIALLLRKHGHAVSVTNRTPQRGRRVSEELGIPLIAYDRNRWHSYRSFFFAVRSSEYIVTQDDANALAGKTIIDLSAPFAADPSLSGVCTLINLDTISGRIKRMDEDRKKATEEASLFIAVEIRNYMEKQRFSGKEELIKRIFEMSDRLVAGQMKHLSKQISLSPEQSDAVRNSLEKERDMLLSAVVSSVKSGDDILSKAELEKIRKSLESASEKRMTLRDML